MSLLTGSRTDLRPIRSERRRSDRALLVTVVFALLGAAVGWWASTSLSPGFRATASVVVTPLSGNPFADGREATLVNLQTEAQLARSDAVLDVVARSGVGPSSPDELRSHIFVSVVDGAEVMLISYRAPTADQAERMADTLARATLDERARRGAAARDEQEATVRELITETSAELAEADTGVRRRLLSQRLVSLRDQLATVREQPADAGSVLGIQTRSDSRRTLRLGLIALGALGGAAAGMWLSSRLGRRRISEPSHW